MKPHSAFRPLGVAALVVMVCGAAQSAAFAQAAPPEAQPAPGSDAAAAPATPPSGEAPPPIPPPPPPPPPKATEPGATEADAAATTALADVAASTQAETETYRLNLYGFSDVTYTKTVSAGSFGYPVSSFYVGNLNLYASGELGDSWRTLMEVRFTYLPNGSIPSAQAFSPMPPPPTDTAVPDYVDLNRPLRWGGVVIERAYVERTFLSWLTLRAGQFLTPYGIWNVDHGSPVIIGVYRPFIVGDGLFPASQTGLEALGAGLVGPVEIGYHLTLSNGRGPTDTYRDMDGNKAVGWRLWARRRDADLGTLSLGFSGYRGKYTNANQVTQIDASGNFSVVLQPTVQYDELSLGGDLKWERGGALVQSEIIMNEVAYNDAYRPAAVTFGGPPGFVPDNRRWGVYGLAGYRFQFLGIMPWAGGEFYDLGKQQSNVAAVWGGLNIRPTPRVVLKVQLTRSFWTESLGGFSFKGLMLADFQIAWSF
jgi:hypothetical protein